MLNFGKHIRELLSRREAAIFPGFGALIVVDNKELNADDSLLNPPGARIEFDQGQTVGDGKLVAALAADEGISEDEAKQQLLELVDAIKFSLDRGENYNLHLVGSFSRDEDNHVLFKKDPNWVIDPEVFGLTALDLLELEAEEEEKEVDYSHVPDEPDKEEKLLEKSESHFVERKPVNKWKIIWIVVASLLVVLTVILILPWGDNDSVRVSRDGIIIKDTTVDNSDQVDTIRQTQVEIPADNGEDMQGDLETNPDEQTVKQEEENIVSDNDYFIIAGSFRNLQNASDLHTQLISSGLKAEIIITETRLYRVSAQSYPTKNEALADLARIQAYPGLESAWVWRRPQ